MGETFVLAATATSGLAVTFGSLSPNVCSVSGATVHFLALGECVVAADQGGNASFRPAPRATSSILVVWPFHGFANPIEDPPSFNELAAGHAASLRFSLEGDRGLHIFPAGSPFSIEVSCTTGAPIGHAQAVPAGDFELRYQPGPDRYTLSWATSAGWAGSCRELALFLTDRSTHVARFAFR